MPRRTSHIKKTNDAARAPLAKDNNNPTASGKDSTRPRTHVYANRDGTKLYRMRKTATSRWLAERWDGKRYVKGIGGVPRVLYNWPAADAAATKGEPVYITEGEKDADTLNALALAATTNPFGAGSWRPEFSHQLMGVKKAVIFRDNDEEGLKHAAAVARSLEANGITVELWRPPDGYKDITEMAEDDCQLVDLHGQPVDLEHEELPQEEFQRRQEPATANGRLPAVLQLALDRLEAVSGSDGQWSARCPAHDDKKPSLSITQGDKHAVVVTCHTGCELHEIADALDIDVREFSSHNGSAALPDWEVCGINDARRIAAQPVDWVIPHLLAAGEKAVIAGPPKQLKTWLALHLARSSAMAEPVFGSKLWQPTSAQSVLFVQEEGASQRWAHRVERTFADAQDNTRFRYVHRGRMDLSNPYMVRKLIDTAKSLSARLIVLDPWQRITPGVKENDATETGPAWQAVHDIAGETDAAVILLHHTRKDGGVTMDAIRGSIRMAGEVDLLVIMRKKAGGVLDVNVDGREYVQPDSADGNLQVTYDIEKPWEMDNDGFVAADAKGNSVSGAVLMVLSTADGWLSTEKIQTRVEAVLGRAVQRQGVTRTLRDLGHKVQSRPDKRHKQGKEWALKYQPAT